MKRYNFVLILLMMVVGFWLILNEDYSIYNIGVGFIIGIFTLFITQLYVVDSEIPDIQLKLVANLLVYLLYVFMQIFVSSFNIVKSIVKNQSNVDRVIIDLPTEYGLINAIICNTITLTPGTITLEMNDKKAEILVLNPEKKPPDLLKKEIEKSFGRLKNL